MDHTTMSPNLPFLPRHRQAFAEAKTTAEGRFAPTMGTGNAAGASEGGFVRGDTYSPSGAFKANISTPPSAVQSKERAAAPMLHQERVRQVFSKSKGLNADAIVGRYKGNPAFWTTLDPRNPSFDHVHMIQMSINWLQMKGAYEYVCAGLTGMLVLREEANATAKETKEFTGDRQLKVTQFNENSQQETVQWIVTHMLPGHARRLIKDLKAFSDIVAQGKKVLKAPTIMAEALDRFLKENASIKFVSDAETAAEWKQSSQAVRDSLFGNAAEVTFLEVFVRILNDPFGNYKALHHVEALEADIRQPKPVGMPSEVFHQLFKQRLLQYHYANDNQPMFPTEQKAMACLVRCYSKYPEVVQVLSTFETMCQVHGTVAPWLPDSNTGSAWQLDDLMKYIEGHSELNGNINTSLPKACGSN